ncbi:MAG: hypothetical protein WCI94_00970 [Rhodospirillales bacterium]
MDRTAPHSARTAGSAPSQGGRQGTVLPPCIAAILDVVRVLLRYGQHLGATLPNRGDHADFPAVAAGFGTYDMRRILAHVQRGILRAMMLQRYLLIRAEQGRDIVPTEPDLPAEPDDIAAMATKRPAPIIAARYRAAARPDGNDPLHFSIPSLKELEAQVRRRSVGRTISEICLDLGVTPSGCDGAFWFKIYETLAHFDGKFEILFGVQQQRRKTFEKEREKRPDTWACEWCNEPKSPIRRLLGYVLGEPPPTHEECAALA